MPQIFDRSSNSLARMSLLLSGLLVIALGFTLDALQRSPWVTRQGQRADQPVPFSHKHHVQGLGLQCQFCHTSVEKSFYAGVPPTKTCMNCHSQIWTNANLLQPVRASWENNQSLPWTRVHDLPDYVYFNHQIHVNKGLGCSSCHGRVDEMPIMYQQNTLQMEWCLNCHRNAAVNLRPTTEIYNMAWTGASELHPVWCKSVLKATGVPTAQTVACVSSPPRAGAGLAQEAALVLPPNLPTAAHGQMSAAPVSDAGNNHAAAPSMLESTSGSLQATAALQRAQWVKFTNQKALGGYLIEHYNIRSARELSSCEVCHR
jgi:hypothetical protein